MWRAFLFVSKRTYRPNGREPTRRQRWGVERSDVVCAFGVILKFAETRMFMPSDCCA